MKPLGVGVVGAGGRNIATAEHLPAIRRVDEFELRAVCDVDAAGVSQIADHYGVEAYTDYAAMLARDDIELVQVCTPDFFHAEHTIMAARAGKHVLCQKPIALSLDECRQMAEAVRAAGVYCSCVQSTRYEPAYRSVKRILDSGALGAVRYVRFSTKGRPFSYPTNSPYRRAGGGQFIHNGMHPMDLVCNFLGEIPERVCGVTHAHYPRPEEEWMASPNYYASQMRFPSGALAMIEMNLLMMQATGFSPSASLLVVGERGQLTVGSGDRALVERFDAQGRTELATPEARQGEANPFVLLMRDFARAIQRGAPAPIPLEFSFGVLEACLKTVESAAQARPLELEMQRSVNS